MDGWAGSIRRRLESHPAIEIIRGVEQVAGIPPRVGSPRCGASGGPGESWTEQVPGPRPVGVIAVSSEFFLAGAGAQLAVSSIQLVALDRPGRTHATPSVGATNWSGAFSGHPAPARARSPGHRDHPAPPGPRAAAAGRGHRDLRLRRPQALGVHEAAREAGLRIPDEPERRSQLRRQLPVTRWSRLPSTTCGSRSWRWRRGRARCVLAPGRGRAAGPPPGPSWPPHSDRRKSTARRPTESFLGRPGP